MLISFKPFAKDNKKFIVNENSKLIFKNFAYVYLKFIILKKKYYLCLSFMAHKILSIFIGMILSFGMSARDSLTVYLFLLDECRICQEMAPELNRIYQDCQGKQIGFLGVFPNFSSKKKGIEKFKSKYEIKFETKTDYFKKMTNRFNATVLPEVILYNETKKTVVYRGMINDLFYAPSKRRHHVNHHYLRDAIYASLLGRKPNISESIPIGCFINFNDSIIQN